MKYALVAKHGIKLGIFIGLSRKLHLLSEMFQVSKTNLDNLTAHIKVRDKVTIFYEIFNSTSKLRCLRPLDPLCPLGPKKVVFISFVSYCTYMYVYIYIHTDRQPWHQMFRLGAGI